jgi:transcriptional regulator with XRE-family HTH domain
MKRIPNDKTTPSLAATLSQIRARSGLTQSQVAERMGTKQASIARLERGEQSPSVRTLRNFANANGYCLEIGFVEGDETTKDLGAILVIENNGEV